MTRRTLFKEVGYGMGGVALTSMLAKTGLAQQRENPMAVKPPHYAPKAKNVIFLFMAGAPSQLDMFDPKPTLVKHHQQPIPEEIIEGERFAFIRGTPKLLGSPHKFEQAGQSGQWMSSMLPHLKTVADDISVIRSMTSTQFNHAPAQLFMNTGFQIPGRPSMGSWLTYGLGTENQDLPGFVVLLSGQNDPDGGKSCWGSGFLPTAYQGVEFRSQGEPVLFVDNPDGVSSGVRRDTLDAIRDLNQMKFEEMMDPEISTRISQYELAYRMQTSVPELMDIDTESEATHELYGTKPGERNFGNSCLLARRLVERGVRFVQCYHRGWDHHGTNESEDIKTGLGRLCKETDQPAAALIKDLKQRGLLDETLVIWAGEFGRTPMNEARNNSPFLGRDHHNRAFTIWMAGGGIKPGVSLGQTDELGFNVVEDEVKMNDLHATVLHLLGMDHTQLTYLHQGRDFRLTDVEGELLHKLL
jgi:hypothetical protein